jgi:hypothetical protein
MCAREAVLPTVRAHASLRELSVLGSDDDAAADVLRQAEALVRDRAPPAHTNMDMA